LEVYRTLHGSGPASQSPSSQVHRAVVDGRPVAVKVQRAGLRELFDVDLKNLKKLAELLDKFDPKTVRPLADEYGAPRGGVPSGGRHL